MPCWRDFRDQIQMSRMIIRPRMHIGLADMGLVTERYGAGLGFSISEPSTAIEFSKVPSDIPTLEGFDHLDEAAQTDLAAVLRGIAARSKKGPSFHAKLLTTALWVRNENFANIGLGGRG
jgi:hypothetical protein